MLHRYGSTTGGDKSSIEVPHSILNFGNVLVCAFYRCRHRNLIDLMGYCPSPPMLVYEYAEKGNLHEWLFTKVCS